MSNNQPVAMFANFTCKEMYEQAGLKYTIPMTAKEIETEEEQIKLLADHDYYVEEKFDGTRATLHFLSPLVHEETDLLRRALLRGSCVSGGMERIYKFFVAHNNTKELVEFLKKEYGTGGFSFEKDSMVNYSSSCFNIGSISYMWGNVAQEIQQLIVEGKYYPALAYTRCFSRRESVKTNWFSENTDSLPQLRDLCFPELAGTIIDGEMFIPNRPFKDVAGILNCNYDKAIARQEEMGYIVLHAFDILYYKGVKLENMPLYKRKEYLQKVIDTVNSPYIKMVEYFDDTVPITLDENDLELLSSNKEIYPTLVSEVAHFLGERPDINYFEGTVSKRAYYEHIVLMGGEGVILKPKVGKYLHKRGREYQKIKKFLTRECIVMGFTEPTKEYTGKYPNDRWDYWITDEGNRIAIKCAGAQSAKSLISTWKIPVTRHWYNEQVGNIRFGVIVEPDDIAKLPKAKKFNIEQFTIDGTTYNVLEVGECSGFDDEMREYMTKNAEELVGSVVEIKANELFKDTGKLRHPRFLRFRPDCNAIDQTWKNHLSY